MSCNKFLGSRDNDPWPLRGIGSLSPEPRNLLREIHRLIHIIPQIIMQYHQLCCNKMCIHSVRIRDNSRCSELNKKQLIFNCVLLILYQMGERQLQGVSALHVDVYLLIIKLRYTRLSATDAILEMIRTISANIENLCLKVFESYWCWKPDCTAYTHIHNHPLLCIMW